MQRRQGVQQGGKGSEVGTVGGMELPIRRGQFQLTTICQRLTEALDFVEAAFHVRPITSRRSAVGQHTDHVNDAEEPPPILIDAADGRIGLLLDQREAYVSSARTARVVFASHVTLPE